ncbi:MAG: YraN family protein [Candidatus Binataceae bacterium]
MAASDLFVIRCVAQIRLALLGLLDWVDRLCEELPWCERQKLGPRGERIAARHLSRRGYRIVARNFRAADGEIDLVAMDNGTLVFIEVKTRSGTAAGLPQEAVDLRKQARIRRAAAVFASRNRAGGRSMRFDVIAIIGVGRRRSLELLKDAF